MFKKLLATSIILTPTLCFANPSFLYVVPTIVLQNMTAGDDNFRGISPRLGMGYAAELYQGLYLAGEVNVTAFTQEVSEDSSGSNLKMSTSFDASILPGMMFSENTFGFLRLGVTSGKFEGGDTVVGGEIGLGLQAAITNNWYIRGEYIYIAYGSTDDISAPKVDTFALGAIYAFN